MADIGDPPDWNVWAVRLGTATRPARDNFVDPGNREGEMALDFTMWVLSHGTTLVVLDTGFEQQAGRRRGRSLERTPAEAVRQLGLDPGTVDVVVLSHLHYDHAGNVGDFPHAEIVVQSEELQYVTSSSMARPARNHFFEVDDIVDVVRRLHRGQVRVVDGDLELAPGLHVHLIGGHTQGLQVVRVHTARGWVVLASDALHYYDNFAERNPFPAIFDLERMLEGYDRLAILADSLDHIIPGHDPHVFQRYAGTQSGLPEGVVALDRPPLDIAH
ncbi:N-acyl homoserine lactonase family protein [Aeromicrobium sp. UC242_57]|uniref:N-acyl homoserine lactonase family protein n=1 Tax=Aeromicrobium sp. UC242_57 TaxID=3374624 RepID=UPI0037A51FE7